MSYVHPYWLDPEGKGPYAAFLAVITSYLHPEAYRPEDRQRDARQLRVPGWAKFKADFREVLADPGVLPEDALFKAAGFDDGSDEAFLARAWREIYGDEPPVATTDLEF